MKHQGNVDGIVLHVQKIPPHDCCLTVLSAEEGRFTLYSRGALSYRNKKFALSQFHTYANFEYSEARGMRYLKCGEIHRRFFGEQIGFNAYLLVSYLAEVMEFVTDFNVRADRELRLYLNALHAVEAQIYPIDLIKGAFELRVAVLQGFGAHSEGCAQCRTDAAPRYYFNVMNGELLCPECFAKQNRATPSDADAQEAHKASPIFEISSSVLAAIRYCMYAPLERIFAFTLKDERDWECFIKVSEAYLMAHLDHSFATLHSYYTDDYLTHDIRNKILPRARMDIEGNRRAFTRKE